MMCTAHTTSLEPSCSGFGSVTHCLLPAWAASRRLQLCCAGLVSVIGCHHACLSALPYLELWSAGSRLTLPGAVQFRLWASRWQQRLLACMASLSSQGSPNSRKPGIVPGPCISLSLTDIVRRAGQPQASAAGQTSPAASRRPVRRASCLNTAC